MIGMTPAARGRQLARRRSSAMAHDKSLAQQSWRDRDFLPQGNEEMGEYTWHERVFLVFDDPTGSSLGAITALVIMLTILFSTILFVVESHPDMHDTNPACNLAAPTVADCHPLAMGIFNNMEVGAIIIFTLDYLARLAMVPMLRDPAMAGMKPAVEHITATARAAGLTPALAARRAARRKPPSPLGLVLTYMRQPLNVIDFLAIAPFYIELAIGGAGAKLAVIRVLRLTRVLRLLKMGKHNKGMQMLTKVVAMSGPALSILVFFSGIAVVLFAALIFIVEGSDFSLDPDHIALCPADNPCPGGAYVRRDLGGFATELSPFASIPFSFWWVCTSMTTVGYGEFYPTSTGGRFIAVGLFFIGVLLIALPITILGMNFEVVYAEEYGEVEVAGAGAMGAAEATAALAAAQAPPTAGRTRSPSIERSVMTAAQVAQDELDHLAEVKQRVRATIVAEMAPKPLLPPVDASRGGRLAGLRGAAFSLLSDSAGSLAGRYFCYSVLLAIVTSTISFCMESMPFFRDVQDQAACAAARTVANCEPAASSTFHAIETVCIAFFTFEYCGRLLTVGAVDPKLAELGDNATYKSQLRQTLAYVLVPMNLIDLAAIVPFYVGLAGGGSGGGGLAVLRVLRLLRVFRIFKMGKYSSGASMVFKVVRESMPALSILFFMELLSCVMFSSCIFFAEGQEYSVDARWLGEHPRGVFVRPTADGRDWEVSPFRSIPFTFWWFFTTTTTVGYGASLPVASLPAAWLAAWLPAAAAAAAAAAVPHMCLLPCGARGAVILTSSGVCLPPRPACCPACCHPAHHRRSLPHDRGGSLRGRGCLLRRDRPAGAAHHGDRRQLHGVLPRVGGRRQAGGRHPRDAARGCARAGLARDWRRRRGRCWRAGVARAPPRRERGACGGAGAAEESGSDEDYVPARRRGRGGGPRLRHKQEEGRQQRSSEQQLEGARGARCHCCGGIRRREGRCGVT
jgi:hypothetical protein